MGREFAPDYKLQTVTDAYVYKPHFIPLAAGHGYGRVLRVGPTADFQKPGDAAREARSGDIIEIEAGEYRKDSVIWSTDDLLIRGVGGTPHINGSEVPLVQEKGIWLIKGSNVRIENIEFSGAVSRDRNGAGIRAEGDRLHVIGCFFHDNETGILSNPIKDGRILIEHSEFARNGYPDGQAHQIYITGIKQLTLRFNYIHSTRVGSAVKSRARINHITYNRIVDGASGSSNYSIDLSNGGRAFVIGNEIEQGPLTENHAMIAFAPEGERGAEQELFVVHNTLVNDRYFGLFIKNRSSGMAYLYNNLLVGNGRFTGDVVTAGNVAAGGLSGLFIGRNLGGSQGSTANKVADAAGIRSRAYLDYRLTADSPAIDAGTELEDANGTSLVPQYEYVHPVGAASRSQLGAPDAGAFEFRESLKRTEID
jgi:hypothetical protein